MLNGNSTTGFNWEPVAYDPSVNTRLGEATHEGDGGETVGAGGRRT